MKITAKFAANRNLLLQVSTYDAIELMNAVRLLTGVEQALVVRLLAGTEESQDDLLALEFEVNESNVSKLELRLGGEFNNNGRFTIIPTEPSDESQRFACREVAIAGAGKGCEDIVAADDIDAKFKCGLVAGNNKWLGGDARRGQCQRS